MKYLHFIQDFPQDLEGNRQAEEAWLWLIQDNLWGGDPIWRWKEQVQAFNNQVEREWDLYSSAWWLD